MRCIAGFPARSSNGSVSAAQPSKQDRAHIRLHWAHARETRSSKDELKGVARLVQPRHDESEMILAEENESERDYLGHLLQIADDALHIKGSRAHGKRRHNHSR